MASYGPPLEEGEWSPITRKSHFFCCCDCGLVHRLDFKSRGGKIFFRAFRDNRATSQRRRHGKPDLIKGEDLTWRMVRKDSTA